MTTATIRDVAKQAGVGVGTVSRVLNNHPSVSPETRTMVEGVIADLDFSPNLSARRLSLGKTLTIAVVAPFFTRPAFVERLRGVVAALADTPYDIVVYDVETPQRRSDYFRDLGRADRCDGLLIVALPPTDGEAERFLRSQTPLVLLDCHHPELNSVVIDDRLGGEMATQHLLDLGHRKIGFISDSPQSPFGFIASRDRYRGYRDALTRAGIQEYPGYHAVADDHGIREAKNAAEILMALDNAPSAIFAASDTQAIGVMQAVTNRGLRVPEDISIIGYDDIEIAEFLHLTTIHQPLFTSGVEAVQILTDSIEQPEKPRSEVHLPLTLITRQSTAPHMH